MQQRHLHKPVFLFFWVLSGVFKIFKSLWAYGNPEKNHLYPLEKYQCTPILNIPVNLICIFTGSFYDKWQFLLILNTFQFKTLYSLFEIFCYTIIQCKYNSMIVILCKYNSVLILGASQFGAL